MPTHSLLLRATSSHGEGLDVAIAHAPKEQRVTECGVAYRSTARPSRHSASTIRGLEHLTVRTARP